MTKILVNSLGKALVANGQAFTPPAPPTEKAVNYRDYDGTIVASYTTAEFASLVHAPSNPQHSGLVSQGWNWPLADAKTYVASHGGLEIGQHYITSDGKTRLYVNVNPDVDDLPPAIFFNQSNADGVTIDWGDGSATETSSTAGNTSLTHQYSTAGDYVITMARNSGTYSIGDTNNRLIGGGSHTARLNKIELGAYVTALGWMGYVSLDSITIPSTALSIGDYAFYTSNLYFVVIPSGSQMGKECYEESGIKVTSLPPSVTFTSYTFYGGHTLRRLFLPEGVTLLPGSIFGECYSLASITIPSTVTEIGQSAFYGCYNLSDVYMLSQTPPTLGTSAFTGYEIIHVPSGSLSAYQSATNWSNYASKMVES